MVGPSTSKLISYQQFTAGHALSFTSQPYLKELFERTCNPSIPLTIVVGAGVSMNAGLRSWEELVSEMIGMVGSDKFQKIVHGDKANLMRKVEMVLQLINGRRRQAMPEKLIREALYQNDMATLVPGELALSIAKLASLRRADVRLITTNFDTLLEEALRCYVDDQEVTSFALDEVEEWSAAAENGQFGVMHVHGIVPPTGQAKGPFVLSESEFFQHGAKVRRIIADSLESSCAIFVGLSMSDPNLIGPLYDLTAKKTAMRFALTVPEAAPGAQNERESTEYALEVAKFMEAKFRLSTVLLKSYSQLHQVLADLSLAILEPNRYLRTPSDDPSSLVYGARLRRALDQCYSTVGCAKRDRVPDGRRAATLNDRLYRALHADQGPVGVISRIASDSYSYDFRRSTEKLSLFLWLRSRGQRGRRARYALSLIGMSAYSHREEWSLRSEIEIMRATKMTASQAVFYGAPLAVDLERQVGSPIWRGLVALPIVLDSTSCDLRVSQSPADLLTVGAITLNSTHRVAPEVPSGPGLSILALFDDEQMKMVLASIRYAADAVLTPDS